MSALTSWQEEKQSAWLYRQVAALEPDATNRALFTQLADAAETQAGIWARELDEHSLRFRPSWRARLVAQLLRLFGPRALRPVLAAMKIRGVSVYTQKARKPHHPMPRSVEEVGARHGNLSGGNLRAAVFGVNDGLVSNTSLLMGMAGASSDVTVVAAAGVAGLLAGGLSMAAGEYVSVRSQREMYEFQIGLERDELAAYPDEEAEELALIYAARGMEIDAARQLTRELMQDPEQALDVLAREELGLNPDDLGSPWGAGAFSFVSFSLGAALPLLPFLFGLAQGSAVVVAAVLAALALFAVGAALSLFVGRGAWRGGLRMLAIGGGAGVLTYVIGHWLGVALA